MEKFLLIARREKEKTSRIALNLTAHIEGTGELEWKKSSFEDTCFSEQGDLESDLFQRTTRAVVFRLDIQVLLSLQR